MPNGKRRGRERIGFRRRRFPLPGDRIGARIMREFEQAKALRGRRCLPVRAASQPAAKQHCDYASR